VSDRDITSSETLGPETETGGGVTRVSVTPPSWQEQDVLLRDMWIQNKPPFEIASTLGRSVAAIMTRAARLGLPRRAAPGRKPGNRAFTSGDSRMTSPRPAVSRAPEGKSEVQTTPRICLMCLRSFPSQGRHNRICSSCKNSADYVSAVSLADINIPV